MLNPNPYRGIDALTLSSQPPQPPNILPDSTYLPAFGGLPHRKPSNNNKQNIAPLEGFGTPIPNEVRVWDFGSEWVLKTSLGVGFRASPEQKWCVSRI